MSGLALHDHAGVTVIVPMGRLDALAAPPLEDMIAEALDGGHARLIVDLSSVYYLSSSGLRVLLVGARHARQRAGDLKLCGLSPRVKQVICLAGFDQVFQLFASRDQALAAFSIPPGEPEQPCQTG